jgi:hypothetical protein
LLRAIAGPLPRPLESVADRSTAADRDQRYPDALAFAEDLRRFQDEGPVSAHREGSFERLERIVGRYRTPILLVLVYLLLRALFIIFSNR